MTTTTHRRCDARDGTSMTTASRGASDGLPWQDACRSGLASASNGPWASATQAQGYGLTTKEFDGDVGLYYFWQRWYSQHTAGFLNRDPLQSTNRYIYAGNNPINFVDPTGELKKCPNWEICVYNNPGWCYDWLSRRLPFHVGAFCYRELGPPGTRNQCCYKGGRLDHSSPDKVSPAVGRKPNGDCVYGHWRIAHHTIVDVLSPFWEILKQHPVIIMM